MHGAHCAKKASSRPGLAGFVLSLCNEKPAEFLYLRQSCWPCAAKGLQHVCTGGIVYNSTPSMQRSPPRLAQLSGRLRLHNDVRLANAYQRIRAVVLSARIAIEMRCPITAGLDTASVREVIP